MQTEDRGRTFSAPTSVERVRRDTGLTEAQQGLRATLARIWGKRVRALVMMTGCSVSDALRAIEDADKENAS